MTSSNSNSTSTNSTINTSGEGSRPSTSGGVDNLGAADTFTPGQTADAGRTSPTPDEKMTGKRQGPGSDDISNASPNNAK
jgi:hypothetical protein